MEQRTCRQCHAPLAPPRKKWCSDTCRAKFNYHADPEKARARWHETRDFTPRPPFDCASCGVRCVPGENVGRRASRFCSLKCRGQWHRQYGKPPDRSKYKYKYKYKAKPPPVASKLAWVTCGTCSAAVVVHPKIGRPLGGWRRAATQWHCPDCPWWPDNQTNTWTAGRCVRCDAPYLVRDTRGDAAYCSSQCARGAAKDRRRSAGAEMSPIRRRRIFERDGWRCQLCGKMTRKDQARLMGGKDYYPDAPTIDHMVPVSKGGTNDESNLQTAHWSCNSIKSAGTFRREGEQLRLVA